MHIIESAKASETPFPLLPQHIALRHAGQLHIAKTKHRQEKKRERESKRKC